MGFKDRLKSAAESGKESAIEARDMHRKHAEEMKLPIKVTSGKNFVPTSKLGKAVLWVQPDGRVYFGQDPDVLYTVVDLQWQGPRYQTITHTDTKGEQKRKGRVIGAAVGTMILPGVGTAIGAAHGSGNKKTESHAVSYDTQVEVPTPASVTLRRADGSTFSFGFSCDAKTGNALTAVMEPQRVAIEAPSEPGVQNDDSLDALIKLKKLLDMGAITDAEYQAKKSQLLGL